MSREQEAVNIRLEYEPGFNAALDADPELNEWVNRALERFLAAEWGRVTEEEAEKNNSVVSSREGTASGKYFVCDQNILIQLRFDDPANAVILLGFGE